MCRSIRSRVHPIPIRPILRLPGSATALPIITTASFPPRPITSAQAPLFGADSGSFKFGASARIRHKMDDGTAAFVREFAEPRTDRLPPPAPTRATTTAYIKMVSISVQVCCRDNLEPGTVGVPEQISADQQFLNAHEDVYAGYGEYFATWNRFSFIAGVRVEHTRDRLNAFSITDECARSRHRSDDGHAVTGSGAGQLHQRFPKRAAEIRSSTRPDRPRHLFVDDRAAGLQPVECRARHRSRLRHGDPGQSQSPAGDRQQLRRDHREISRQRRHHLRRFFLQGYFELHPAECAARPARRRHTGLPRATTGHHLHQRGRRLCPRCRAQFRSPVQGTARACSAASVFRPTSPTSTLAC